jgi:hypothetical protein
MRCFRILRPPPPRILSRFRLLNSLDKEVLRARRITPAPVLTNAFYACSNFRWKISFHKTRQSIVLQNRERNNESTPAAHRFRNSKSLLNRSHIVRGSVTPQGPGCRIGLTTSQRGPCWTSWAKAPHLLIFGTSPTKRRVYYGAVVGSVYNSSTMAEAQLISHVQIDESLPAR